MNNNFTQLSQLSKVKETLVINNIPKKIQVWRGEIFYADINGNIGSEQGGIRPVLVVQNDIGNTYSPTTIVVMLTSELGKAKLPTHIELSSALHGLASDSVALFEQIRTIDKKRLREKICKLDELTMEKVDKALLVAIMAHKSRQPIDRLPNTMQQIINRKLDNIYHYEGLLNSKDFKTPNFEQMCRMEYDLCLEDLKVYCKRKDLRYEDYYKETLVKEIAM